MTEVVGGLTGIGQDLVGGVFGPVYVSKGIRTVAEDFALVAPDSFHLGWGRVRLKKKAEYKLTFLWRSNVVFESIGCIAQCLGCMRYVGQTV